MILLWFCHGKLDQVSRAGRRHFLCGSRPRMGTAHLLELFPSTLVCVKLQVLARVNLLPEEAAFCVAAEHSHVNPDRLIIGIEHDHATLQCRRLAHIAPLKTLLE